MLSFLRDAACHLSVEVVLVAGLYFSTVAVLFCGSVAANSVTMPTLGLRELVRFELQTIQDEESAHGIHAERIVEQSVGVTIPFVAFDDSSHNDFSAVTAGTRGMAETGPRHEWGAR